MRFAAFETSTDRCSVALWCDGELASLEARAGERHAELALPILERLLAEAGLAPRALDAVAFGAGPGSFTGLRIACALAQGLAFALARPVLGVSTLEALVEECGEPRALALLDARAGEVYWSAYERTAAGWREAVAPRCTPPSAVVLPPGEWAGCGPALAVYPELARRCARAYPEVYPSAHAVARLAAPRLAAGEGSAADTAAPVYLRDRVALTEHERARVR